MIITIWTCLLIDCYDRLLREQETSPWKKRALKATQRDLPRNCPYFYKKAKWNTKNTIIRYRRRSLSIGAIRTSPQFVHDVVERLVLKHLWNFFDSARLGGLIPSRMAEKVNTWKMNEHNPHRRSLLLKERRTCIFTQTYFKAHKGTFSKSIPATNRYASRPQSAIRFLQPQKDVLV